MIAPTVTICAELVTDHPPVNAVFIFNTMPGNCAEELSSVWSFDTMFAAAS
jgi:hypothetical protein